MPTNGPVSMEDMGSEVPSNIEGREVDPDKDEVVPVVKENPQAMDMHMAQILEHVPKELHERVSKITRAELAMPGVPRDREAYEAYLFAEKMMRDLKRKHEKDTFNWDGVPKLNG